MKNTKKTVAFILVAAILLLGAGDLVSTLGAEYIQPPIGARI